MMKTPSFWMPMNNLNLLKACQKTSTAIPKNNQEVLKKRLSVLKEVRESQIFLGNGSDEAIDLILRCFARPMLDNIIIFPPLLVCMQ
jgi:histidinol-phosphate/aromatic aminotransferase/cobyric acid decarboxylase-like protein